MLQDLQEQILKIGHKLGLNNEQLAAFFKNDAEHKFDIALDNGKRYKAYRVQHNNQKGPYKGGIRFHEKVNLEEASTLALLMSLKTAAVGLSLGGAKGGIAVNPRGLNNQELEELSRKYVQHLHRYIGPDKDVPAPDVNTNAQIMDWMADEYQNLTNDRTGASFTGKSLSRGGIKSRQAATGKGGVIALMELLKLSDDPHKDLTFAVQGFGNVGIAFALNARDKKYSWHFVAAADSSCGLYSKEGLNLDNLTKFKQKGGRFSDYKDNKLKIVTSKDFTALDVDVLVLSALEDAINISNMMPVKAKYIVELANGPITSEAYTYLSEKGIKILPDIIANAGGVIVSYLEWFQNKKGTSLDEKEVDKQLEEYMTKAIIKMYKEAEKENLTLKDAALAVALKNIFR